MNLKVTTTYALYAAMEMAAAGERDQVTAAEVAGRYGIPASVLAKVFQQLVRAGIAIGTRGSGGGYQLAGKASELTMLEVIDAFEPRARRAEAGTRAGGRRPGSTPNETRLRTVFDEIDELVRCTFASITLETLVGTRAPLDLQAGDRAR